MWAGTAKLAAFRAAALLLSWLRKHAVEWYWWTCAVWWGVTGRRGPSIAVQRGEASVTLIRVAPSRRWPALYYLWAEAPSAGRTAENFLEAAGDYLRVWLVVDVADPRRSLTVAVVLEPEEGAVCFRYEPLIYIGAPVVGPESWATPPTWSLEGVAEVVLRGDTPASAHILSRLDLPNGHPEGLTARLRRQPKAAG